MATRWCANPTSEPLKAGLGAAGSLKRSKGRKRNTNRARAALDPCQKVAILPGPIRLSRVTAATWHGA
ncbi:MAG: hypothetical protein ACI9HE_002204 [Planctomycetota bacterium]|jgi:hypothetical protein